MNLILSIIYAPIVLYFLKNFDTKTVCLYIFIFSFIWFLIILKKGIKEFFFPLIYLIISIFAYFIQSSFVLKCTPFLISLIICIYISYTYISQNSFIFYFIEKFNIKIDEKEKVYIQKSTLFWLFFSIINVLVHYYFLFTNMYYWAIYSSIGWYLVFIIAAVIQFIHRKFYF